MCSACTTVTRRRRRGRPGSDPENRIAHGDLLELRERGRRVDREVGTRARCELEVALEYRCALARRHFNEPDRLAVTVVQHGFAAGCLDVLDPVGARTEHRHEIARTLVVGYDYRQLDRLAAAATTDLERARLMRPRAVFEYGCPPVVDLARQPVGLTACIKPAIDVHLYHPTRSSSRGGTRASSARRRRSPSGEY
jgi:hypothetical protein